MTTYPEKTVEVTARYICRNADPFPPDYLVMGLTSSRLRPNWMNYIYDARKLLDIQCAALGITPTTLTVLENGEAAVMPAKMDKGMADSFHDTIQVYCMPSERSAEVLNHDEVYANLVSLSPYAKMGLSP
jgi:hypothetical protein